MLENAIIRFYTNVWSSFSVWEASQILRNKIYNHFSIQLSILNFVLVTIWKWNNLYIFFLNKINTFLVMVWDFEVFLFACCIALHLITALNFIVWAWHLNRRFVFEMNTCPTWTRETYLQISQEQRGNHFQTCNLVRQDKGIIRSLKWMPRQSIWVILC